MSTNGSENPSASGQQEEGIGLDKFLAALATAFAVFGIQLALFLLFRNKLSRIYKPKTYMVPERERTDPPPVSPWSLVTNLIGIKDRDLIKKCGLDAYFFLRYLQMLLVIFIPIAFVAIPILVPINYIGGLGKDVVDDRKANDTTAISNDTPRGLDTLAWQNVAPINHRRRWAHLVIALAVIAWVCYVVFLELRVYIKVRQDYLTSAEHRLRASANTVLVSSIPEKWLTEEGLRGLFDVFPGGIRNIWITRDFTKLLEKVRKRDQVRDLLESAQSDLIRDAQRKHIKRRAVEEKKQQRARNDRRPTKQEKQQRDEAEDAQARLRAQGSGGISAGDHEQVPQIEDALENADANGHSENGHFDEESQAGKPSGLGILGKVGQGLGQGLKGSVNVVGKAGQGIIGGAKMVQRGVDGQLEHTGGFGFIDGRDVRTPPRPQTRGSDRPRRAVQIAEDADGEPKRSFASEPSYRGHAYTNSDASQNQDLLVVGGNPDPTTTKGNTTRKASNLDGMIVYDDARWWQFWKPPGGGYASPIPQGQESDEFPLTGGNADQAPKQSLWAKFVSILPFVGDSEAPVEYPVSASEFAYSKERDEEAEWKRWLKESRRPTHRLANFEWTPSWLPGLPLINKKVDTIYWARGELARLNMEIEEDQKHPERYPLMTSAFIQFNNQVAAHMACQSVTHHVPRQMGPRMVEVAPNDIIWENMAISWWSAWLRFAIVTAVVTAMVVLWAFPVAFTSGIANLEELITTYPWLEFLKRNEHVFQFIKLISGVLPAIILAILLLLVPIIFTFLAKMQGAKTGAQQSESVQRYYFFFLFVQLFLVVSISDAAIRTLREKFEKDTVGTISSIPQTLADNLPKAANYFFSYMILQALSVSSGTLLQIGTLAVWYVLGRILDNTARAKWRRQTMLPNVNWGSFFPVYTNFACIALIYSVVAPIISIFAIITFGLLWLAHRYNMFYVIRFRTDTGGVLFPTAINQLFTGLYLMELCLIGLFFLSLDENGNVVGFQQAIVMIVALILTVIYQVLLNKSFSPLFRYLPITFEDEAVLRDEAFQRAQNRRLGLADDSDDEDQMDEASKLSDNVGRATKEEIEMRRLSGKHRVGTGGGKMGMFNPVTGMRQAGSWAIRGTKQIHHATIGKAEKNLKTAANYRRDRRRQDLEAQRAIGEALYGGYHDEIEDLTPDERDVLVREAFKHEALRSRRPAVWIPQDTIGVSDDEILRTHAFSEYIWMSNEGTALDSKVRVIYGRAPPDFSEMDIINL